MKKTAFILAILMFLSFNAWAGASRIIRIDETSHPDARFVIKAEGDDIPDIEIPASQYTPGSYIYGVATYPSTPDGTYAVTITDANGLVLCSAADRTTDTDEGYSCHNTTGKFEKGYGPLTISVGDLGSGSTLIVIDLVK